MRTSFVASLLQLSTFGAVSHKQAVDSSQARRTMTITIQNTMAHHELLWYDLQNLKGNVTIYGHSAMPVGGTVLVGPNSSQRLIAWSNQSKQGNSTHNFPSGTIRLKLSGTPEPGAGRPPMVFTMNYQWDKGGVGIALPQPPQSFVHDIYSYNVSYHKDQVKLHNRTGGNHAERALTFAVASCPNLPTTRNGDVSLSAGPTSSRWACTFQYVCHPGYQPANAEKSQVLMNRTCMANGQWSGKSPFCESKCGSPRQPAAGRITSSINNTVTYRCETGYTLNGSSKLRCQQQADLSWEWPPPRSALAPTSSAPRTTLTSRVFTRLWTITPAV